MILFLLMFRVVCGVFRGFGISFFFLGLDVYIILVGFVCVYRT
jgi:hypothetical protein